jgi:hypothetical protein
MATFNVDTFGQELTFDTEIDLTGYTGLSLLVRTPTGATETITTGVAVSGDDVDGVLTYTVTEAVDLWDVDGDYRITPQVLFTAARHESASPATVTIKRENQY